MAPEPGRVQLRDENSATAGKAGSVAFRTAKGLAALGAGASACIVRGEAFCALGGAILCVVWQLQYIGRPFWYDELCTFYISRLADIGQTLKAIRADGNPPLYFLLARACLSLPCKAEVAARLPALLGFAAALFATWWFVRRRCGAVLALFGMLTLATCANASYAVEARPYALMLGFLGLTLVSWQAATEDRSARVAPLVGVAVGIAGALASHHYGVFHVGVPLMLGEAVRLRKRRRLDFPLYCACAAGLSMLAVTMPLAAASHRILLDYVQQSVNFWAKPRVGSILSYGHMVKPWLPGAFLALALLTKSAFRPGDGPERLAPGNGSVPAHEVAAAVGLALMVPVMIGVTWFATGYYMGRYAIGSAMGIALLAGIATPFLGRNRDHATVVAALCTILFGADLFAHLAHAAIIGLVVKPPAANSVLDDAQGSEPIVVASALTYMPTWWYASPPFRERLHYLADVPFAVRQPDFLPELALVANRPFVPSKVDEYRQFLSTHRRFLLYCTGSPRLEWVKERLQVEKWSLKVIRSHGAETLFLVEAPDA